MVFKKGLIPWNKNLKGFMKERVVSEETRKKISKARKGKRLPEEVIQKHPLHKHLEQYKDEIIKLYKSGLSLQYICNFLREEHSVPVDHTTVSKWLKRWGVKLREGGFKRKFTDDQIAKILEEYNEDQLSYSDLCKKYGISVSRLYRILKERGKISYSRDKGKKISRKMIGRKISKEQVEKWKKKMLGYWTPENKEKMRVKKKIFAKEHPEFGKEISIRQKKRFSDQKEREKHSLALKKGKVSTPEWRKRMSKQTREYLIEHPEAKEKLRQIVQNKWKDPVYRERQVRSHVKYLREHPEVLGTLGSANPRPALAGGYSTPIPRHRVSTCF